MLVCSLWINCTNSQVAYHGVPIKAYEVFITALKARYLERGFALPELEDQNPAGVYVLCVCVRAKMIRMMVHTSRVM